MRFKETQLIVFLLLFSCSKVEDDAGGLKWRWLFSGKEEVATQRLVYEERFGNGNTIRLNQSMAVFKDKAFCFNDGKECRVYDLKTMLKNQAKELPDYSHHNNAQFLKKYYQEGDKYPLLLLSRGDYPPNQSDLYVVRVTEENDCFSFTIVKTIHNTLKEAQYNGSWVADEDHNKLFLYCMTSGDWRTKEENVFCIYSFPLPDTSSKEDVTLGYEDVLDRWDYEYLIHQGGTYYNGYLFFNVEGLTWLKGAFLNYYKNIIAINVDNGLSEISLPLDDYKETEGISVYDEKLYVSFKNGNAELQPEDIVFSLYEYSLPSILTNVVRQCPTKNMDGYIMFNKQTKSIHSTHQVHRQYCRKSCIEGRIVAFFRSGPCLPSPGLHRCSSRSWSRAE